MKDYANTPLRAGFNKTELALAYFPNSSPESARRALLRWFAYNPPLMHRLLELGYNKLQHYFTPAQVDAIYEFLGEP